ncbi:hypothetical protein BJ138DRAFT_1019309, partial [Hygrophoropsis aurantiaca]
MLSAQLVSYVIRTYSSSTESSDEDDNENADGSPEYSALRLFIDGHGELVESNQVHDYLYRSPNLKLLSFYEFARCVELERNTSKELNPEYDFDNPSPKVHHRHSLLPPHPLASSHHLLEHTNLDRGEDNRHLVPRVIGRSIPSPKNTEDYYPFMLGHFKPFSISDKLLGTNDTFDSLFHAYKFDQQSLSIMRNWDAIHECEDARD